jgi:RHS repeat-associated protein
VNGRTRYWGNGYSYDAWGNLTDKGNLPGSASAKCGSESLHVTADAQNRMHAPVGADYQYDAAGNMTYDASGLYYTYDAENRITGANGYTYTYDDEGNRVEKSNGSTGTLHWYMSPGIVAESDLTGTLKSEYVFFGGERVARRDGVNGSGGVFYYFSDHLKTASVITDAQGNIKSESDYYPWGGELQFTNNDSNHYKFTGKERDSETGLDYFGARYYSNGLGRFITPDWAGKATAVPYAEFSDPQSLNLYSYVRNIPTSSADADGHCGPPCAVLAGGASEVLLYGGLIAIGTAGVVYVYNQQHPSTPITMDSVRDTFRGWFHPNNSNAIPSPPPSTPTNVNTRTPGITPADVQTGTPGMTSEARAPAPLATATRPGTLGKPDHQATVQEEAARINGDSEVTIRTPNGTKGSRRADAIGTNPETGAAEIVQVYRPTPAGNIPKRERDAAKDIQNATGVKPTMVPVRPLPKPQP